MQTETRTHEFKRGKSLSDLCGALDTLQNSAVDYFPDTRELTATVEENRVKLTTKNDSPINVNISKYSGGQLATFTNIPGKYFGRLQEEKPELLADNINHGLNLAKDNVNRSGLPQRRMVRTIDKDTNPTMRAFLSDSYKTLDCYDLLQEVMPIMQEKQMQVISSELTPTKMHIKVLSKEIAGEVKKGEIVRYGFSLSNSDIGAGTLRFDPYIMRLVCLNGMQLNDAAKYRHSGGAKEDNFSRLLSEKTVNLTEQAFWSKLKDLMLASMDPARFELELEKMRGTTSRKIEAPMLDVITRVCNMTGVNAGDETKKSLSQLLANGNDGAGFTQWGLINSFTAEAQSNRLDYEQGIELEKAAGQILDLTPGQWQRIAC